jgi:hypothetical protein
MPGCVNPVQPCVPDASGRKFVSTLQYENIALIGSNLGFPGLDRLPV